MKLLATLPALLLVASALGGPLPAREPIPPGVQQLFRTMDEASVSGDTETLLALFSPDYRAASPVGDRESLVRVVRKFARRKSTTKSRILGAASLGTAERLAVSVDHELRWGGKRSSIAKTYFLERSSEEEDYRIAFSADVLPSGRRLPSHADLRIPYAELDLRGPEGWVGLELAPGPYIWHGILVDPSQPVWVKAALLDPGARSPASVLESHAHLKRWFREAPDPLEIEPAELEGISGMETTIETRKQSHEVLLLVHGGLHLLLEHSGGEEVGWDSILDLVRHDLLASPREAAVTALAEGRIEGRGFEHRGTGIRFEVPKGWSLEPLATSFDYRVQARSPDGLLVCVGAWSFGGDDRPSGPGKRKKFGKGPSQDDPGSVFFRQPDGTMHFFRLEKDAPSPEELESFEKILASVRWEQNEEKREP